MRRFLRLVVGIVLALHVCASARAHDPGLRDWIQCEPDSYQWRKKPDAYVIGQKPEPFCRWLFEWLGARPDDTFHDLFPGSGAVGRAWENWCANPGLPVYRGAAANGRAQRRAEEKMLREHPNLLTEGRT